MKKIRVAFQGLFPLLLALMLWPVLAMAEQNKVVVLRVDSAIGPAVADYIHRGITASAKQQASLVILQLDTPGGLDKSMRTIIKTILTSPIPVATFIAPSGARAASAGTFILYASHIATMAPGTNLGAASPVSIGGGMLGEEKEPSEQAKQGNHEKTQATAKEASLKKATNDAIAYIRSLAQLRGRNAEFAELAVSEAATLTAEEALKAHVIEYIASDVNGLLQQLNKQTVKVFDSDYTLHTEPANVIVVSPDWRVKLLSVITDPSIAYILLLIGIYGLFFEFVNPGFILPGVVGAIALLLALYALQMLPISYAGLGLIILGILFMVAEAFVASFGALGIGGVIAFIAGSILLLDAEVPGYQIAWPLIVAMAVLNAIFFFFVMSMAIRARQRRIVSGREELIGLQGVLLTDARPKGQAKIKGEIWTVRAEEALPAGSKVCVLDVEGIILWVKRADEASDFCDKGEKK